VSEAPDQKRRRRRRKPERRDAPATGADSARLKTLARMLDAAAPQLLARDVARLSQQLRGGRNRPLPDAEAFGQALEKARRDAASFAAARPAHIDYPPELPVTQAREALMAAIRDHQVVVVCGETGSGKSTQLPKLCLELGRGSRGLIGHTQPRRLAARALASRIAAELKSPPGRLVGFETRFDRRTSADTRVKLMTDGILLAELTRDRELSAYDTIILDEAHERSLNIDFLLGYLRQLLPRRPDLKLIITSATLDPERLSAHFGEAPILRVEGRSFPVTMRYQPPAADADVEDAVADSVESLWRGRPDGDVLVFLPGEREIRDCARVLGGRLRGAEVLPLYSRLAAGAQDKVFSTGGRPRVVLATNVAETSITVPGVRYVVDTGTARINRFQPRAGVQSLHIEPISQAAANQRAGRCGRVGPGICVRLYGEDDFQLRPAFTDPEIRRSNLAGVILQMAALRLGDVEDFPWVDAPDNRHVTEGYRLLLSLGALDEDMPDARSGRRVWRLTPQGRELARLPLDPRVARIALAARGTPAQDAGFVLAAALSVQDPHESPGEARDAAASAHGQWRDKRSDFITLLNLWDRWQLAREGANQRQQRRWCQTNFLSWNRMQEWAQVAAQVQELLGGRDQPAPEPRPADGPERSRAIDALYAPLHEALLAGLLDHVGQRVPEKAEYQGPRGRRFRIFPGSGLIKKSPAWLMSAALMQTSQLYARTCAAIEPEWLERVGAHLVRRVLNHPEWDAQRGEVTATELVHFYGLQLVKRARHYGSSHPAEAREIFIREALVRGDLPNKPAFLRANLELIESIREKEVRLRRPELLADEEQLQAFYETRIPADVCTAAALRRWLHSAGIERRAAAAPGQPLAELRAALAPATGPLHMREIDALRPGADADVAAQFPDHVIVDGHRLEVEYRHDPGAHTDGVTFILPLALLFALPPARFDWLVPGLRPALFEALIRTLPNSLRRHCTPAADYARALTERLSPDGGEAVLPAICAGFHDLTGFSLRPEDFTPDRLEAHLRPRLRLVSPEGTVLGEAADLPSQRQRHAPAAREAVARAASDSPWVRDRVQDWDFDTLPEQVTLPGGLIAHPALVQAGGDIHLRPLESPRAAREAHALGARALMLARINARARDVHKTVRQRFGLSLATTVHTPDALAEALVARVADAVFQPAAIRDRAAFDAALAQAPEFTRQAQATIVDLQQWFAAAVPLRARMADLARTWPQAVADMRAQLDTLLGADCAARMAPALWPRVPVYLEALRLRLDRLANKPQRDAMLMQQIHAVSGEPPALDHPAREVWEEWRVALFAQELKAQGAPGAGKLQAAMQQAS
jgi:ATP-dependent helicase HrpA